MDITTAKTLLEGRVALVTGGSRGIGAAVARALGGHGAAVGVNYVRDGAAADHVVSDIIAAGSVAMAVRGDVSDPDRTSAVVEEVSKQLGDIDVLVCNVFTEIEGAVGPGSRVSLLDQFEPISRAVHRQLAATMHACRLVVPGMRRRGGGSIVIIGADATRTVPPQPQLAQISIAKAAQDMFTRLLAVELGPDKIRVNVVAPGMVPTHANDFPGRPHMISEIGALTPLGRVAEIDDVADAVVAFASDLTRHVTGSYLAVDGGITMS
jgi:3-oxoacyl-[acyl-carrier protein] reductase